jgi:peptide/nickel transport system substrate-binding protein
MARLRINAHNRLWGAVAALLALGMLAACAGGDAPAPFLTVGLESAATDLDPRFATDAASARIGDLVFRSLTRLDEHHRHVPDLASAWQLEDARTLSFELRRDARFADGTTLTAADVRATYQSILDPATGSPKRGDLGFLAAVDDPDEHTVRFHLRGPFAPFLESTTLGILPRAAIARGGRVLVGSGPYRIAEVRSNGDVRLVDGLGQRAIPEIVFRVIPDDTVRTLELEKGTVDFVENAIEPDNVRWLEGRPRLCVERTPGTTFQYLGINFADPRLRDVRVRRAIALAIDREDLVHHLLGGDARPATGLLAPEHWAYDGDVHVYPHDPAAAKRLLDEAGFPDPDGDGPQVRFRLSYKTSSLDSRRRVGEALQSMLAAVGIGLDVRSFEWATFYDDVRRGNFQLYSLAWIGVNDPDFFYGLLHSTMRPPLGNNRGGYSNPEMDRLTEAGRDTLDPRARRGVYAAVQRLTAEDLPFIPLWWTDNVVVRNARLCGFVPRPDGSLASFATTWLALPNAASRADACGCAAR